MGSHRQGDCFNQLVLQRDPKARNPIYLGMDKRRQKMLLIARSVNSGRRRNSRKKPRSWESRECAQEIQLSTLVRI